MVSYSLSPLHSRRKAAAPAAAACCCIHDLGARSGSGWGLGWVGLPASHLVYKALQTWEFFECNNHISRNLSYEHMNEIGLAANKTIPKSVFCIWITIFICLWISICICICTRYCIVFGYLSSAVELES